MDIIFGPCESNKDTNQANFSQKGLKKKKRVNKERMTLGGGVDEERDSKR